MRATQFGSAQCWKFRGDGSRGAAEDAEKSLPSAPPRARPFAAPQLKTSVSWPAVERATQFNSAQCWKVTVRAEPRRSRKILYPPRSPRLRVPDRSLHRNQKCRCHGPRMRATQFGSAQCWKVTVRAEPRRTRRNLYPPRSPRLRVTTCSRYIAAIGDRIFLAPLLDKSPPFRICEVEDLQDLAPICLNYFANTYPTLVQHRYLFSQTP